MDRNWLKGEDGGRISVLMISRKMPLTRKRAAFSKDDEIEVLVDIVTSRENVIRFAKNAGW